jgi:hypothetical protein
MFDGLKRVAFATEQQAFGWQRQRRAERHCDQAINGTTRHWLQKLPARRRPLRLCMAYPRVANRIAWVWADAEVSAQVLTDLLEDRRGGRQGFAPSITRELRRLQEFNAQQRHETKPEGLVEVAGRLLGMR